MNKIIKVPYQKTRAHRVLFEKDSPFRDRVENKKREFKRNSKHRNRAV